ncbi:MAG: diguanylate cyclase domain-containing protein [Thainema sp.]
MQPLWKQVHAWTEAAVFNLETTDFLLRQATAKLAAVYHADCLLWAGFAANQGQRKSIQVFTCDRVAEALQQTGQFTLSMTQPTLMHSPTASVQDITCLTPVQLPTVIQQLQRQPQLLRLPTGDLVVPWISGGHTALPNVSTLQFVLQLQRSPRHLPSQSAIADSVPSRLRSLSSIPTSQTAQSGADFQFDGSAIGQPIRSVEALKPWTTEEIRSLEIIGKSLILAYQSLFWRERLEQSRHRTALVGRVTQLINSRLNPSQVIQRLVDELGQDVRCDCLVLLDMRGSDARQLAAWTASDADTAEVSDVTQTARAADPADDSTFDTTSSTPLTFPSEPTAQALWQDVIDMFTQGGASYLELDLTQPQMTDLSDWLSQLGAVKVLIVPLFVQTEFFGCFVLLSQQPQASYPLEQLQTIRLVADQTAIALINARYYVSSPHQDALLFADYSAPDGNQDSLTGLLNRHALNQELDNLSTPTLWVIQQPFAILLGDLDYFQMVNDTYGHSIGDEILQEVAERMRSQLRHGTSAYRYGGEEFVILLPDTLPHAALDVAERLRRSIQSHPFATSAGDVKVTISFGIAYQDPAIDTDASTVMQRAEQALEMAKYQGRDCVVTV